MAYEAQIGGDGTLFVGEDKTLRFECVDDQADPQPVDMTNWTLRFDIRVKDNSADPAIVTKTPTLTGVFNSVRALNTQRALVFLTDDDTNLFKPKAYRHSLKRMDASVETVLVYGNFVLQQSTVR